MNHTHDVETVMQLLFDESDDGTISDDFSSMESQDSSPPQSSSTAEPGLG